MRRAATTDWLDWLARALSRGRNSASSVAGRVVTARSTGESAPAAAVTLAFRNASGDAVEVRSYELRWPGGAYRGAPRDLRLAAWAEVERVVRVDTTSGDVSALLSSAGGEGAREVLVDVVYARVRRG